MYFHCLKRKKFKIRILRMVAHKKRCFGIIFNNYQQTTHSHQRHAVLKYIYKLNRLLNFHSFLHTQIKSILRKESIKSNNRILKIS